MASCITKLYEIWNSRSFQRFLATLTFCLYISDVFTDCLVGYDLVKKCHVVLGSISFTILFMPGAAEGLWDLFEDILRSRTSCLGICKALTKPIWFFPDTVIKLFKVIINPESGPKVNCNMVSIKSL